MFTTFENRQSLYLQLHILSQNKLYYIAEISVFKKILKQSNICILLVFTIVMYEGWTLNRANPLQMYYTNIITLISNPVTDSCLSFCGRSSIPRGALNILWLHYFSIGHPDTPQLRPCANNSTREKFDVWNIVIVEFTDNAVCSSTDSKLRN